MSAVELRRWSRAEYERLIELGFFPDGERAELIDGEIVTMAPQDSEHSTCVHLVAEALHSAFGPGFAVRIQVPLAVGERSEPEPDVAVVVGALRDYSHAHPTTAALVVEVARTSLAFDRGTKGRIYAQAGIIELWIIDLVGRQLEVYRDPGVLGDAEIGYRLRLLLGSADEVQAGAAPGSGRIRVADLLP